MGLPNLEKDYPQEVERVKAANILYDLTAECCAILTALNVTWSVENPTNSLLWWLPSFADLQKNIDVDRVDFQCCAYEGVRPKWSCFLHWPGGVFSGLQARCPGVSHDHVHAVRRDHLCTTQLAIPGSAGHTMD